MNSKTDETIVLEFNKCINNQDINGLEALMTDDHAFIDSADSSLQGKAKVLEAWRGFFEQFPDYRNIFETVMVKNFMVTIIGHSVCSDKRLNGPALWTAQVNDGKVSEWRVYADTPQNRSRLGIDG